MLIPAALMTRMMPITIKPPNALISGGDIRKIDKTYNIHQYYRAHPHNSDKPKIYPRLLHLVVGRYQLMVFEIYKYHQMSTPLDCPYIDNDMVGQQYIKLLFYPSYSFCFPPNA